MEYAATKGDPLNAFLVGKETMSKTTYEVDNARRQSAGTFCTLGEAVWNTAELSSNTNFLMAAAAHAPRSASTDTSWSGEVRNEIQTLGCRQPSDSDALLQIGGIELLRKRRFDCEDLVFREDLLQRKQLSSPSLRANHRSINLIPISPVIPRRLYNTQDENLDRARRNLHRPREHR